MLCVQLLQTFEPAGEEVGTKYNESTACSICGSGATQVDDLILPKLKIPRRYDISASIAREIIVSERFYQVYCENGLSGLDFKIVRDQRYGEAISGVYQLGIQQSSAEVVSPTIYGRTPLDLFHQDFTNELRSKIPEYLWDSLSRNLPQGSVMPLREQEMGPAGVIRCRRGDKIGGSRFSELHIRAHSIDGLDFTATRQYIGMRAGFLRPYVEILISSRAWQFLQQAKITGFVVEPVRLE